MKLGMGLWIGAGSRARRADPIDPLTLFAAGERGGWFDPSDLATLFNVISGGAAPAVNVSANNQTIALMLDKSRELALGAELVVNGDFSAAPIPGWTPVAGSLTRTDGVGILTSTSAAAARAWRTFPSEPGKTYLMSGRIGSSSGTARANIRATTSTSGGSTGTLYQAGQVTAATLAAVSGYFTAGVGTIKGLWG